MILPDFTPPGLLTLLAISVAGGVGAMLRFGLDQAVRARLGNRFPWGIVLVNLSGAFALGLVTGAATSWLPEVWAVVLGTGLLGGYTTFSTASADTLQLLRNRRFVAGLAHGLGMLLGSVLLALLGLALGLALGAPR